MGAHALISDTGAASRLIAELGQSAASQPMLGWDCASITDTGLERAHNEDSLCLNLFAGLMILADGMGGYNAGEVASALAVERVRDMLSQRSGESGEHDVTATVQRAFAEANAAILAAAARRPECLGMGTTLVLACVGPRHVTIGHVGDSRAYLLRNGRLARLTRDHSVGQAMIDAGVLDEQAARASTLRGVLTRALGVEPAVDTDISQFEWQRGDRFLLCSDGLTDMVPDSAIRDALANGRTAQDAASGLVSAALGAGGHDNISVLLAFCEQPESL